MDGSKPTSLTAANFESIFSEYYPEMVGFALKYLTDQDTSEELVQEVFASLWANIDLVDIKTNVRSYLFGAIRHTCLNYFKHQKVISKHEEHIKGSGEDLRTMDWLEFAELEEKLQLALEKLPPKCREVFDLSRVEVFKYQQID